MGVHIPMGYTLYAPPKCLVLSHSLDQRWHFVDSNCWPNVNKWRWLDVAYRVDVIANGWFDGGPMRMSFAQQDLHIPT